MKKTERSSDNTGYYISMIRVALLFPGVLMGAGFASGKEMWQFFTIFGGKGLLGAVMAVFCFAIGGIVVITLGSKLKTDDIGKILCPFDNKIVQNGISIIVGLFLFTGFFSMLAAAGAIFEEQLSLPKIPLTAVFLLIVVFTAIKGFRKVSVRLGLAAPVLIVVTVVLALIILIKSGGSFHWKPIVEPSPVNRFWWLSVFLFVSYNMTAVVSVLGSASQHIKDLKTGRRGALLGSLFVSTCVWLLMLVTFTDPALANEASLPMLAFCKRFSPVLGVVYSCVLLISMFGTATSLFYGIANKIPAFPRKQFLLWGLALAGFGCSLAGFKNLVAYVYPAEGYISFLFMLMMIINYFRVKRGETTCLKNSLKE